MKTFNHKCPEFCFDLLLKDDLKTGKSYPFADYACTGKYYNISNYVTHKAVVFKNNLVLLRREMSHFNTYNNQRVNKLSSITVELCNLVESLQLYCK